MVSQDMIYLLSCAVNRETPDAQRAAGMDLDKLYEKARRHMVTSAVGYGLEAAGIKDARFVRAQQSAALKSSTMDMEMEALFTELDAAGIWYMPLKGIVLQHLYPIYGMRQMSDHDILFDASRAEDVRKIMESLGFTTEHFGQGNHDVYHKKPVSNFEMHRALFGETYDEKFVEYYRNIGGKMLGDSCEKHLSPEDFYVYITAHEYKHFSVGGTGIRSLLDCYVYLKVKGKELDFGYIEKQLEMLGIVDFEKKRRKLALKVFAKGTLSGLTADERELLKYYLSSGTYGTFENRVKSGIEKHYKKTGKRSKLGYIRSRVFPDLKYMSLACPFVNNNPLLYPAGVAVRCVRSVIKRGRSIYRELHILKKYDEKERRYGERFSKSDR